MRVSAQRWAHRVRPAWPSQSNPCRLTHHCSPPAHQTEQPTALTGTADTPSQCLHPDSPRVQLTWVALGAHGSSMHPSPQQGRADVVRVDGDTWVPPAHAQVAVGRGPGQADSAREQLQEGRSSRLRSRPKGDTTRQSKVRQGQGHSTLGLVLLPRRRGPRGHRHTSTTRAPGTALTPRGHKGHTDITWAPGGALTP